MFSETWDKQQEANLLAANEYLKNSLDIQEAINSLVDSDTHARLPVTSYELFSHDLAFYRDGSTKSKLARNRTVGDLISRVDKIDKDLVARVNVTELFASVSHNSWCSAAFVPALRFALEDDYDKFGYTARSPKPMTKEEEKQRYKTKKHMTTDKAKAITSLVSAALRTLATESCLFTLSSEKPMVDVGAFFVEKAGDGNKLRVIIDGRFANIHYSAAEAKFSFFSLETLRQVIDNLSEHKKWYAINIDLRHWFHQIPLPRRFQRLFGLPLTDRGNERGSYYAYPRAFPMGWTYSPLVAQALTWSLVLSRHKDDGPNFPAAADLPIKHLQQVNDLFSWIPLNNGGGIFVLLDNILVVTPKKDVADFWFTKIRDDAKRYNIVLKVKRDPADTTSTDDELLERQCRRTLDKDSASPQTFDFVGVTWSHSEHWAIIKRETEDMDLPNATKDSNNVKPDGTWSGTYRQLASILGRINWHRRIMRLRFFDDVEDKKGTQSLLYIYQRMIPQAHETWNSTVTLPKSLTEGLTKAWRYRNGYERCVARALAWDPKSGSIRWFATDAAKSSNNHTAVVVEYTIISCNGNRTIAGNPKTPVASFEFPKDYTIALGELHAIVAAVKSVTNPHTLVILATDSLNAKAWVEAAKAECPLARALLRELFEHMESLGIRLYLVYVPSACNVADHKTRVNTLQPGVEPQEWLPKPALQTSAILARGDMECRKTFTRHGGQTGGMDRALNPDLGK